MKDGEKKISITNKDKVVGQMIKTVVGLIKTCGVSDKSVLK